MLLKALIDRCRPQYHILTENDSNTTSRQLSSRIYGPPALTHAKLGKELERDFQISKHRNVSWNRN